MGIKKYNQKRNFKQTTEPKGEVKNTKGDLVFVVQKHKASHLHFDFRLELNGVLKSWAVPKGPSVNPVNKRLAMMVEDHPYDYKDFEGTIPEGNYGAGTVIVWDEGTYHALGLEGREESEKALAKQIEEGSIKIVMNGKKLKGEFALVKIKNPKQKNAWLLIKHNDEFASDNEIKDDTSVKSGKSLEELEAVNKFTGESGADFSAEKSAPTIKKKSKNLNIDLTGAVKAPIENNINPTLATLSDKAFDSKEWLFEIKLDGYRAIASVQNGSAKLYSRNNQDYSKKFNMVFKELELFKYNVVFDGELTVIDSKGISRFELIHNYDPAKHKLIYYVFDILHFDGFDLKNLKLIDRKKILKKILPKSKYIKYLDHIESKGEDFFQAAAEQGIEGIVAKRKNSYYQTSVRSKDWLKIKIAKQQEAIICGYILEKTGKNKIGALILGIYKNNILKYIGKVGTGIDSKESEYLLNKFGKYKTNKATINLTEIDLNGKNRFAKPFDESKITWLKPELICEVKFAEWTKDEKLRQAVYLGLREDKKAIDVVKEEPKTNGKQTRIDLKFTNLNKLYWPEDNITKGELIKYYDSIAEYILPHLVDRPQSLRRNPNGIKDSGFFQKNVEGKVPNWIQTYTVYSESTNEEAEYMLCQNTETLLFMANWGCIEINAWNSRVGTIDNPDYVVFDLDPLDIDFKNVVTVALEIKKIFDEIRARSFIKTSGSKGIHIYLPIETKYSYSQAQQFAKIIELLVNQKLPKITSLERLPQNRKGKVYLDYLQNAKGKTMATVYSARPKPRATVSIPLDWSEINTKLKISDYTIKNVPKRLKKEGDIWKNILKKPNNLKNLLKKLS